MTEEQIKEALSRGFVRLVANRAGYKCKFDETDHGVDLTLAEVASRQEPNGRVRLTETGRYVDLQLKCTCDASVTHGALGFKFDLEAKNYNDLVERLGDPDAAPLVLLVFLLPDDPTTWLSVTATELQLQKAAYWWRPPVGTPPTMNTHTIRIAIPYANHADLSFASSLYSECYT